MRQFADGPAARHPVRAMGATGSGREIVGSLASTCYGPTASSCSTRSPPTRRAPSTSSRRVDTIFEIGGQDAKYIRLVRRARHRRGDERGLQRGHRLLHRGAGQASSPVCATTSCTSGKRPSMRHWRRIAGPALLGVHGRDHRRSGRLRRGQPPVIAGIYDSIIQNYLNRVKGSRSVGDDHLLPGHALHRADALAAAVVRQTGAEVIVPPNPGTVGALGIALADAQGDRPRKAANPRLDPQRFLDAEMTARTPSSANRSRAAAPRATSADRPHRHPGRLEEAALHLGRQLLALGQGHRQKEAPGHGARSLP